VNIDAHLEKVRRMEAVRARLDSLEDFELWFWMSMCGGTHAINAALHRVGATDDGEYFCTQSVDVYLERGDKPGEWRHSLRYGCDIIHVGMPAAPGADSGAASRCLQRDAGARGTARPLHPRRSRDHATNRRRRRECLSQLHAPDREHHLKLTGEKSCLIKTAAAVR
jgi:hypothetical protein